MIVEIIVGVFVCSAAFFALLMWLENKKLNKLRREYDEREDKSKRRVGKLEGSELNTDGNTEFTGRILLPSSAIASAGTDTTGNSEDELK